MAISLAWNEPECKTIYNNVKKTVIHKKEVEKCWDEPKEVCNYVDKKVCHDAKPKWRKKRSPTYQKSQQQCEWKKVKHCEWKTEKVCKWMTIGKAIFYVRFCSLDGNP